MKKNVIVVGSGGHASVVMELMELDRVFNIVGYVDKTVNHKLSKKYLGNDESLKYLTATTHNAFVAVGDNLIRKKLSELLISLGFELVNISSSALYISKNVEFGKGIVAMPGSIVNSGSDIGDGCIINTGATIDHDCSVGSFSHIAPGCHLAGNVKVGTNVFLGVGTSVINDITIASNCIIGAGSVIIKDIDEAGTYVGNPARRIK